MRKKSNNLISRHPFTNKLYDEKMYEKCLYISPHSSKIFDLFDIKIKEDDLDITFIEHVKLK